MIFYAMYIIIFLLCIIIQDESFARTPRNGRKLCACVLWFLVFAQDMLGTHTHTRTMPFACSMLIHYIGSNHTDIMWRCVFCVCTSGWWLCYTHIAEIYLYLLFTHSVWICSRVMPRMYFAYHFMAHITFMYMKYFLLYYRWGRASKKK